MLRLIAKNLPEVTGGDVGVQVPALFHGNVSRAFYWAAVVLTTLAFGTTVAISRARFGYYLMAIREDEDTALSVGIGAARNKLAALLVSATLNAGRSALRQPLPIHCPRPVARDRRLQRDSDRRHAGRRRHGAGTDRRRGGAGVGI